jgi:SNF2 family DNA or RNA helicase
VHEIHDAKLEALHEIVESANGQPVLVFYSYQHDLSRIKHNLRAFHPEELEGREHIQRWNEGKVPLLLAHPASAGHGLNMQAGGNIIVWFGLTWSLELYQQANARLDRQGQQKPVIIHHLVTKGTMDEDVMKALEGKAQGQDALMEAVKARIEKYLKRK